MYSMPNDSRETSHQDERLRREGRWSQSSPIVQESPHGSAPCWAYYVCEEISFRENYDTERLLPMRDNEQMEIE